MSQLHQAPAPTPADPPAHVADVNEAHAHTMTPTSALGAVPPAPLSKGPSDTQLNGPTARTLLSSSPQTNEAPVASRLTPNIHAPSHFVPNTYPAFIPQTLTNKAALVTGASRGIGAGIALELARRGAAVVVNYVKGSDFAASVVKEIEAQGGRARAIQADVSKVVEIERLFEEARAWAGKLDIVCSNSGMESFDAVDEITEEKFDAVFGLNLRAQFFVAQAAYKFCEQGGRLVLMSSIAAGLITVGNHALYSGSKSAINGITKSFAKDFGKKGITVNAIAPGGVKSDMFASVAWKYIPGAGPELGAEKIETMMAGECPLGRCAVPEDVARVVAFLVSEDGGWVNGQIITISGGSGQ